LRPIARQLTVAGRPAAFLEAGAGRALVLVHGAGGGGVVWSPQLDGLSDVARVIALDLPGHGATGGAGASAIGDYVAWVADFLDAAGLRRMVLGGHSMGGAVAQALALGHPERIDGLVLVGTGSRLRVLPRLLDLCRDDPAEARRLIGGLAYGPRTPAERVVEAERALLATPSEVLLGDFMACDRFDVMATVGALRDPTLILVGREDRLTPPKYATFLAGAIPGARVVEVPEAGHFPQLEQPGAVNAAIREFLASLA
jgi:pimeloyl-ACP methyl ester carboxylesterase